jgi:hypothetical protein
MIMVKRAKGIPQIVLADILFVRLQQMVKTEAKTYC